MKIPCALIDNRINNKPTACMHKDHACMHRLRGKCYWVESGDVEEFASRRDVSINKFTSEAKKSVVDIKALFIVDRYYEFIRSEYNIYPKYEERINDLEFPFDFVGHIWSKETIDKALDDDTLDSFVKHLPDKSIDSLVDSLDFLRSFFDNDN